MKKLAILIIILFSFKCFAQSDIGIGVVLVHFTDKTILNFHHSSKSQKPSKVLEFFNDEANHSWTIKDLKGHSSKWLKPETLWLDHHAFNFRCKSKTDDWYELIVNNETNKTLWIKKSDIIEFKSWEKYLKEVFSISRTKAHPQDIKAKPEDASKTIKFKGEECFNVKSMKGDWIEIHTDEHCGEHHTDENELESGWIRWKKGKQFMIEYHVTS